MTDSGKLRVLINEVNGDLIKQNNILGNSIAAVYGMNNEDKKKSLPNAAPFACTLVLDAEIAAMRKRVSAVADSFCAVVEMLGGEAFLMQESNSTRFEGSTQMIIEPLQNLEEFQYTPLHTTDPTVNHNITSDDRYVPIQQWQNKQRLGTQRESVVIFITNDPTRTLRFLRSGTNTRRGIGAITAFVDSSTKTHSVPTLGSDLNTNYGLNIFLNVLGAALNNEKFPEAQANGESGDILGPNPGVR